jgi:hypothetical protein
MKDAWTRPVTFQMFSDPKDGPKPDPLARIIHSSLADCAETLERLNRMKAGAFVTVNTTNLRGRHKTDITQIVGWHVDLDFKDAVVSVDVQTILDSLPLKPTMVVRTPGGLHIYWLVVEPMPCEGKARWLEHEHELKAIQRCLADFGADKAACTVERVLRIPGFLHQKSNPTPVELLSVDGPRYTRDQIREAFKIGSEPAEKHAATEMPSRIGSPRVEGDRAKVIRRAGMYLAKLPGGIQGERGSDTTFAAAVKVITMFDLTRSEALDLMTDVHNPKCQPAWSLAELTHKVDDAWAVAQRNSDLGRALRGDSFKALENEANHGRAKISPDATDAQAGSSSESSDWPEKKPIRSELKPVPVFDVRKLLPDALARWVEDEANRMPCPIDFVAAAVLAILGSVIGTQCAIHPKANDTWAIVTNIWGAIVGSPSAKKSPAMSAAMGALDKLIALASELYSTAEAEYRVAKFVHEAKAGAQKKRIQKAINGDEIFDPSALAKELAAHEALLPVPPNLHRYKSNDPTIEKLGELERDNPNGILVVRDEVAGLIQKWDSDGHESDRAYHLEGWNGTGSFDTDRIGRGTISIPNHCLTIFGGMQPDKLISYLEQAAHRLSNDGMLQRLQLLVYPDHREWEYIDRSPDHVARERAFAVFHSLAKLDPVAWGASQASESAKFPFFTFDPLAQAEFVRWSTELHLRKLPFEDQPLVAQHLSKYDKLFPALALIFHLVECASNNVRGPVTEESALRAAAWCDYLEAHARRCYGLLVDDGFRAAQTLAGKLEKGCLHDAFTMRDVRRHQWRGLTDDVMIQAALDWLEDENWLRPFATGGVGPGSGRRTTRYQIHPSLPRMQATNQDGKDCH